MKQLFKLKLALVLMLSIISFGEISAQEVSITGAVVDESGVPLPGATVLVKGTKNGTSTDFDGNFTISFQSNAKTLVVSYVGYATQEVSISNQKTITVTLEPDAASLDEIVIVGYGSQRKSDLTGAVSQVSAATIDEQPSLRVEDAIQGKVAGVQIQRTSGSPDGALRVRIRGTNSLTGNNSPLYVVDGVLGVDMGGINVNDIKSVEVLKDASATAVYGSQGSNGVILVTTKTAKAGKTVWAFNSKVGFDKLVNDIRNPTPYEFTQIANLAIPGAFNQTQQNAYLNDPTLGTNWSDVVFRTGVKYDYQFSAQGGTENIKYYVSTTYNDIEAIVENDDYKRFGLRSNLDFKLSDKTKLTVNLNASRIERQKSDVSIRAASFYAPVSEKYDEFGDYALPSSIGLSTMENPLYSINDRITDGITNQISALARLDLDLFKNVTYSFTGSATTTNSNSSRFYKAEPGLDPTQASARISDSSRLNWQVTNQLNYNNDFGDHSLNVTAVQEIQSVSNSQHQVDASNFSSGALGYDNLNLAGTSIASTNENANTEFQLASFLGRVNYGYKNKYLLTASMRADASSKFAQGNKWAYFPSAAFAWKLTSEDFLSNSETIDLLKLRLSYGKVGSQAIDPYETLSNLIVPSIGVPIQNGVISNAVLLGDPANPDLKWETTAQYDVGIDLEMLKGKLSIAVDYYYKKTSDLLYALPTPLFAGNSNPFITRNVGEMENRGFEFLVSSDIIQKKDFNLNVAANISVNRNKFLGVAGIDGDIPVLEEYQGNSFAGIIPYLLQKNQPLANIRGLIYEGPYRTEDQALATQHGYSLGAPKFTDVNEDGRITIDDAVVIGNGQPDYTLGVNVTMDYKNFDFSMFVQSVQGFDILNVDAYQQTRGYTNLDLLNAWSPTNESSNQWAYSTSSFDNPGNTQYLEDGSFIRLKNITLGYTLPREATSKFGVNSLRFFVNAQNVLTITDYSWYDPEASGSEERDQSQSVSFDSYPNPKSINLGLNVKF